MNQELQDEEDQPPKQYYTYEQLHSLSPPANSPFRWRINWEAVGVLAALIVFWGALFIFLYRITHR